MSECWRDDPFLPGGRYIVLSAFKCLRDEFTKGEALTYVDCKYSAYDGYIAYIFKDQNQDLRVWDLHDDDSNDEWKTHFEKIDETKDNISTRKNSEC